MPSWWTTTSRQVALPMMALGRSVPSSVWQRLRTQPATSGQTRVSWFVLLLIRVRTGLANRTATGTATSSSMPSTLRSSSHLMASTGLSMALGTAVSLSCSWTQRQARPWKNFLSHTVQQMRLLLTESLSSLVPTVVVGRELRLLRLYTMMDIIISSWLTMAWMFLTTPVCFVPRMWTVLTRRWTTEWLMQPMAQVTILPSWLILISSARDMVG